MKIKYNQTEAYGCGLYSVANIFDDFRVTECRIEESKKGNNLSQLNRWIREDGHAFSIEPFYYDNERGPLPAPFFEYHPVESDLHLPVLFDVQISEHSKLIHFISGLIDSDKWLYIFDSYKKEVVKTEMRYLTDMYHNVFGFYHFIGDNGDYIFLNK
ncbi:MAG: hypothetical protein J7599_07565 [Niabella sp.]|nr:hypothetical protein [Niabella sp.]